MIEVKFFGGAKKSFDNDNITIKQDGLTIKDLLSYLMKNKPKDTPDLDVENLLIAINGIDSSAKDGLYTKLNAGDTVSIIPIIHGGSSQRTQFKILNSLVELMEVSKNQKNAINFLENIRKKFQRLKIQGISSRFVLGKSHIKKIIGLSLTAKKNKLLLSNKLETDILMRFAGTNQILRAIETVGIKKGNNFIIIAIGNKTELNKLHREVEPFLSSLLFNDDNHIFLKKQFKISKNQMNSIISKAPLEDLLLEKAAILF